VGNNCIDLMMDINKL